MGTNQGSGNQAGNAPAGNAQHADTAASVGHATSGEAGATPGHETMSETGGSGGAGLTATQVAETGEPVQSGGVQPGHPLAGSSNRQGEPVAGEPGIVVDSGARGAQDTRSQQGGGTGTGLGVPETGANQTPADLEHQAGGKRKP